MEKLDELIGYLTDTLKSSGEFVKEQAPDIAQQILAYGLYERIISIVIAALVLSVAWLILPKRLGPWKAEYKASGYRDFPKHVCGKAVLTAGSVFGALSIFLNTLGIVKITVAPKLYLLSYLADMLKGRG